MATRDRFPTNATSRVRFATSTEEREKSRKTKIRHNRNHDREINLPRDDGVAEKIKIKRKKFIGDAFLSRRGAAVEARVSCGKLALEFLRFLHPLYDRRDFYVM